MCIRDSLYPDRPGDYVGKPMSECTGAEICMEWLYHLGCLLYTSIPRAAVTADEIAECAEFFSFGTNDLTQMTFGFSRDDAGKFLGCLLYTSSRRRFPV